jgi:predicted nucleic acid-binding protein
MILCDTGVIVGLILADDKYHQYSVDAVANLKSQIITTWPCITEAMYLVGIGQGQEALQRMIEEGFLKLTVPTLEDAIRSCVLMRQYADAPMDFADSSLVVASEILGINQILTFDSHFYTYKINDKSHFQVLPA